MIVGDVDAAFPLLPLAWWIWPFFMFVWFDVRLPDVSEAIEMFLYLHVCGDFGTSGLPGTFKIFFSDVVVNMARSLYILTLPMPVYVDDIAHGTTSVPLLCQRPDRYRHLGVSSLLFSSLLSQGGRELDHRLKETVFASDDCVGHEPVA